MEIIKGFLARHYLALLFGLFLVTGIPLSILLTLGFGGESMGHLLAINALASTILTTELLVRIRPEWLRILLCAPFAAVFAYFWTHQGILKSLFLSQAPIAAAYLWLAFNLVMVGMGASMLLAGYIAVSIYDLVKSKRS